MNSTLLPRGLGGRVRIQGGKDADAGVLQPHNLRELPPMLRADIPACL